jgi:ubiquinone/menaquinone biosynthesis C-methylase UbiE
LDANELQDRIAAFPIWNYQFEFEGGVKTPIADWQKVNRQEQRHSYFFKALLSLTGGSLEGRRVLDLGCSSGLWALHAIEAGAEFVLGVDGNETSIEQAELVFEAKGVDRSRYRFLTANVFEHDLAEQFDIALCLGLLNVVSKPVALFELMTGTGAELIVLDTGLSRAPTKLFEVDRLIEPRNAVDYDMVLVPTRQAVLELAGQFGFQTVPLAQNMTDYTSMEDYRSGERLAFICSKGVSLSSLEVEPRAPGNAWLAGIDRNARRVRQRLRG